MISHAAGSRSYLNRVVVDNDSHAAAGVPLPTQRPLDGKNMLPALRGEVDRIHDYLCWSSGGREGKWAVRSGKWKLVAVKDTIELFDLEADVSETRDLAGKYPDKVAELTRLYDRWLDEMADPVNGAPKRWSRDIETTEKAKGQRRNLRKNAKKQGR